MVETGEVTKYYEAAGKRIAMRKTIAGVTTTYYLTEDHLGGTALITNASADMVNRVRYFPYGSVRAQEFGGGASSVLTDKLFTGQQRETSLGLYHFKARLYNADIGSFPQADTVVPGASDPRALNRHAYVYSNPVTYSDPTGHFIVGCFCGDLVGGTNSLFNGGGGGYSVYSEKGPGTIYVSSDFFDQFPAPWALKRLIYCHTKQEMHGVGDWPIVDWLWPFSDVFVRFEVQAYFIETWSTTNWKSTVWSDTNLGWLEERPPTYMESGRRLQVSGFFRSDEDRILLDSIHVTLGLEFEILPEGSWRIREKHTVSNNLEDLSLVLSTHLHEKGCRTIFRS